jgi:hypothetical protein
MPRYTVDPVTGIRTKVSGTNYIPPCLAKTAKRKAEKEPVLEPIPAIEPPADPVMEE